MLRIQKGPLSKDSPLISFSLTMSTIMFPLTVSPLRYVAVGRSNSTRKVFNDGIVHLRSHSHQNYFYYVRIFFIVPRVYYRMTFERKQKIYIRVERTIIHRIGKRNFSMCRSITDHRINSFHRIYIKSFVIRINR